MRVLVCGGRDFNDAELLNNTLYDSLFHDRDRHVIIQGGAEGADTLAAGFALLYHIECKTYFADWKTHGKAAGPIQNTRMLEDGRPDLVVAFPGGKGTADMVRQARYRNVRVIEVMEIGHGHTSSSDS